MESESKDKESKTDERLVLKDGGVRRKEKWCRNDVWMEK